MDGFDGVARMTAYYNEHDSAAAAWLRELIKAGHIAPGIVDERSIEDVTPADLAPFTQAHFFAGIGIWSLALRAAGITDDTPLWTGSCPCQPFSSAGAGGGFDDARHLWPVWERLIAVCRPVRVLGEQVASKDAGPWVDLVQDNFEALDYTFGAVPFPTAGIGGPHIRDRLYWVALGDPCSAGLEGHAGHDGAAGRPGQVGPIAAPSVFSGMADLQGIGRRKECADVGGRAVGDGAQGVAAGFVHGGGFGGMADTDGRPDGRESKNLTQSNVGGLAASNGAGIAQSQPTGPVNGFWQSADWLFCRDGKWRPVEPGTQPLAYGMPRSVGDLPPELQRLAEVAGLSSASLKRAKAYRTSALRGYGNAINASAAQAFIEAVFK